MKAVPTVLHGQVTNWPYISVVVLTSQWTTVVSVARRRSRVAVDVDRCRRFNHAVNVLHRPLHVRLPPLIYRPRRCLISAAAATDACFAPTPATEAVSHRNTVGTTSSLVRVRWHHGTMVAVWRSGNALVSINEVNLRWARLVLGWVTMSRFDSRMRHVILVCNQRTNSTQPSTFRGTVKWVPAKRRCLCGWGAKAGMACL